MKYISSLLVLLCLSSPALAQEVTTKTLTPGETLVSLSATEQLNLQQDTLMASLRIEVDSKNPKEVQEKINKGMQAALEAAKGFSDVKSSTGQYYVYSYDPNPQPSSINTKDAKTRLVWKGNQTIDLSSKDSVKLLELAGKIQELGFVMSGMNYTLSPEQSETYKDRLMTDALKKIQKRAELAEQALGKKSYDIVEVNVDNSMPIAPMPMMYKAMRMGGAAEMSADMSAPVAQAGEQTVTMTVTARVVLKP